MRLKIFLFLLLSTFTFFVQAQIITPSVVNVTGNYINAGGYSLEYSIGETSIGYFTGNNILSEGFLQPSIPVVIQAFIPQNYSEKEFNYIYSQNSGEITILIPDQIKTIELFDINGRKVTSAENTNSVFINTSAPDGIYLVNYQTIGGELNSFKILK